MFRTANEYYNVKSTILIIAGTARSSEWICENSNYELKDNNWPEKSVICIFRSCNCRSWKSKTKRLISIKFSISAGLLETVKICGNWNIEFWGWLENWIFEIFSFSEMFSTSEGSDNVKSTMVIKAGTARNSEWISENLNYELKDNNWPEKSVIRNFRSCNFRSQKCKPIKIFHVQFSTIWVVWIFEKIWEN